ncbi:MAG: hypothetical protein PWP37_853, partial [Thermotogota bacterium]|nr:hypothetical protein [Thermotogota bacterium]
LGKKAEKTALLSVTSCDYRGALFRCSLSAREGRVITCVFQGKGDKKSGLGDRLYEYLLGAPQDCKSSMLEHEGVKRQHPNTFLWLGNCLHKRSLGASQDLETEMCNEERKRRKRSALVKIGRSCAFFGIKVGNPVIWSFAMT